MLQRLLATRRFLGTGGTAAVELALVTPVLLTLSFGGIDYGNLFNQAQALDSAARVGAETAMNDLECAGSGFDSQGNLASGIQVVDPTQPVVSTKCASAIQAAMQSSGHFSPALIFPDTFSVVCKCDENGAKTPTKCDKFFNFSCQSQTPSRGYNQVFMTISASQLVSPLINWPAFPDSINGSITVRIR